MSGSDSALSTTPDFRLRKLLRASAGTGKTYRLTGHYLELLRRGAPADTILATTFTRKAAGEIFGRVLSRLADTADTDPDARRLLLELCRTLHRTCSASHFDDLHSSS